MMESFILQEKIIQNKFSTQVQEEKEDVVAHKEVVEAIMGKINNKTSNRLMKKDPCMVEDNLKERGVLEEVVVTLKEMMQEMTKGLHVRNVADQAILSIIVGIDTITKGSRTIMHLQEKIQLN